MLIKIRIIIREIGTYLMDKLFIFFLIPIVEPLRMHFVLPLGSDKRPFLKNTLSAIFDKLENVSSADSIRLLNLHQ